MLSVFLTIDAAFHGVDLASMSECAAFDPDTPRFKHLKRKDPGSERIQWRLAIRFRRWRYGQEYLRGDFPILTDFYPVD